jgi:hypothetical protein
MITGNCLLHTAYWLLKEGVVIFYGSCITPKGEDIKEAQSSKLKVESSKLRP